jgi:DNA mismatch endonuclease (patch repair protein)
MKTRFDDVGKRSGEAGRSASWATSLGARLSMQANRYRDTGPELALRSAVFSLGLRYRVAARPIPTMRRTADLVFRMSHVAVFVDGCFWHGCPDHGSQPAAHSDYWAPKLARNVARDRHVDLLLVEAGWTVVRVWEHEDMSAAACRVADLVRSANIQAADS